MSQITYCRTCIYWVPQRRNNVVELDSRGTVPGECHRNPPTVTSVPTPNGIINVTAFPLPHSDMYCGKYEPRTTP